MEVIIHEVGGIHISDIQSIPFDSYYKEIDDPVLTCPIL